MSNVLFLGFPASGKTVLLGSFSHWLSQISAAHVFLEPKSEESHIFLLSVYQNLCDGCWPAQTDRSDVTELGWRLRYGDEELLSIDTLDYPGEAFQAYVERGTAHESPGRTSACSDALSKLDKVIPQAKSIFFLINYAKLRDLKKRSLQTVHTESEAQERNRLVAEMVAMVWGIVTLAEKLLHLPTAPSVTLILAQSDRFPEVADGAAALMDIDPKFRGILRHCDVLNVSSVGKTILREMGGKQVPVPDRDSSPIGMDELLFKIFRMSRRGASVSASAELFLRQMRDIVDMSSEDAVGTEWSELAGKLCEVRPYLPLFPKSAQVDFATVESKFRARLPELKKEDKESLSEETAPIVHQKTKLGKWFWWLFLGLACVLSVLCVKYLSWDGFWVTIFSVLMWFGGMGILLGILIGFMVDGWSSGDKVLLRAVSGDAASQEEVASHLDSWSENQQNVLLAIRWWRKSALQGNAQAQYRLGNCYDEGHGVSQSYTDAIGWYRKSAEHGHSDAQYALGRYYTDGLGAEKCTESAFRWYWMAAEQGHSDAQYMVGQSYSNGWGVGANQKSAFDWYQKSADQGHAAAQYKVGLAYERGFGVKRDSESAAEWYKKAAGQGQEKAKHALERLKNETAKS